VVCIQCRLSKDGVRCPSTIEIPDDQVTEKTTYMCSQHTKAALLRANRQFYNLVADKSAIFETTDS
jgi:hypothetical protein